jgi:hypothetical protein
MFQICCGTNIKYIGDFWWGAYGHKHMAVGLHMGRKPYLNWSFVSRHWVLLSTSYYKMYIKLQASFKTGICRGHRNTDGAELPWLICDLQGCTATFSESKSKSIGVKLKLRYLIVKLEAYTVNVHVLTFSWHMKILRFIECLQNFKKGQVHGQYTWRRSMPLTSRLGTTLSMLWGFHRG